MNRILFAAKHVYTVLRMGRPLFVVGSHFICRPRGGLSVSEKDKKMHGLIMVLISSLRVVLLISLDKSCHFTEPIVNRGEWLWNTSKFFVVCCCSVFALDPAKNTISVCSVLWNKPIETCILYKYKTKDCALSWTFQHKSCMAFFVCSFDVCRAS